MYQVLIFLACLAVGFGAANKSTIHASIHPIPTSALKTLSMVATSSMPSGNISSSPSSMPMSTSMIVPNSTLAPQPPMTSTTQPTTTPKPTTPKPTPKPTSGDYSVKKNNDTYCLLAKLKVSFKITFGKYEKKGNGTHVVQANATVAMPFGNFSNNGSKCGSKKSTLMVSWPKESPLYFFTMKFEKTKDQKNVSIWEVIAMSLTVTTKNNPAFKNATNSSLTFFGNETVLHQLSGRINGSYLCGINKDYPFHKNGMMSINSAKLQPFDVPVGKDEVFGEANNCEPKPSPEPSNSNIVPIAVGCALAGLVLIVLIAYIIGRRKSQRGYEKV